MEITVDVSKEIKSVEDLFFLIDSLKETKPQMEQKKTGGRYEEWQSPNTKPEETDKKPRAGSGQPTGCKEHGRVFRGCQPDSIKKAGFIRKETKDKETKQRLGGRAVEILMGVSAEDIEVIRELEVIAEEQCKFYENKEDAEGFSKEEVEEFSRWILRESLFRRMEALVDNQMILKKPAVSARDAAETCENCSGALKEHYQRMERMAEHDRKVLDIAGGRMDVGAPS